MFSNTFKLVIAVVFASIFWACSNNALYDETTILPDEGWDFNQSLKFSFPVTDTSLVCDILLHLRNEKTYAYSNLWLFLQTTAPNGASQSDTLELMLADESGRWMGKGARSINTMLVPYVQAVKFPQLGVYNMEIRHAMRDTIIENITDIGIRVQFNQ